MRTFFKFFQKTQMSGMRLVWVHSSGIVEMLSFVHRSTFRSVYIIVGSFRKIIADGDSAVRAQNREANLTALVIIF